MQATFDPYYRWLGIPPNEQPADYYRLLGVPQFEADEEVISNAADARMGFVRTFQSGRYSAESQRVLNELSVARVVLLNPDKRREYDGQLRVALQRNVPAATAPAPLPVAPVNPPWAFHPPAPGYGAAGATPYPAANAVYSQVAPYPQATPYPQQAGYAQPGAWVAPAVQPTPNFVGGALAEAEAAKANAQVIAPVVTRSLPPAFRRRESLWRNPWMVAAGGTLLTIIAVFVMLRAGDFAREPEFVDANVPTITVPPINVLGEGKQLPRSKSDNPVEGDEEATRNQKTTQPIPQRKQPTDSPATSSAIAATPLWHRRSSPFAEFAVSADDRWVATHTNTRGVANWAIYELRSGAVAVHVSHRDGMATELRPAIWPAPGPTAAAAGLFNVQGQVGIYLLTAPEGARTCWKSIHPQALFAWGGSNGEYLIFGPDPKRGTVLLFDRQSGRQVGGFGDFEPGSQLTGLQAKEDTLLVSYHTNESPPLYRSATFSLASRTKLQSIHSGPNIVAGATLTRDGTHFVTWYEPKDGKILGARTAVTGGGSAIFAFQLQEPGEMIDLRFAYSPETSTLAVANRKDGVLQLYNRPNEPPHTIRFPQGIKQLALVEGGSRLITQSVAQSLLTIWDTNELLTKTEAVLAPADEMLSLTPPVEHSLASAVPWMRGGPQTPVNPPTPAPMPASSDPIGSATPKGDVSREEARTALAKVGVRINPPNENNVSLGPQFTDDYARYLLAFPEIDYVQASQCAITGKTLQVLGQLKQLKTLQLMRVQTVTDDDLKHLANSMALEQLSCFDTGIKGPGIAHLVKLKTIKHLHLGPSPTGIEPWQAIGQLKSLESIPPPGPDFDNASLELIANLTELKNLHLSSTRINGEGYRHLARLEKLTELYLPTSPANPSEYQHLGKLKQLRTLSCGGSGGDEALDYLTSLTELQYLHPPADITDAGLETLAKFPNLQRTNLFTCSRITESGLAKLTKCDKLIELVIGQHVTPAGWESIASIKSLKSIQCGGAAIPAAQLALLGNLPNLDSMAIGPLDDEAIKLLPKLTKLKSLHMSRQGYSPADLESLSRMSTLEHLFLNSQTRAEWTDEHVAALKKMTQLKNCITFGTVRLSPANLAALKQANPKCQWGFTQ